MLPITLDEHGRPVSEMDMLRLALRRKVIATHNAERVAMRRAQGLGGTPAYSEPRNLDRSFPIGVLEGARPTPRPTAPPPPEPEPGPVICKKCDADISPGSPHRHQEPNGSVRCKPCRNAQRNAQRAARRARKK